MKYLLTIIILTIIVAVGYYLLNPKFTEPNIITLDTADPAIIVTNIENSVYSTSTPVDKYATIRWAESGTHRNKDIAATGVYLSNSSQNLVQLFDVTKVTLEKNNFVMDSANSFGDLAKDPRQDVGYLRRNVICTVSINKNDRIPKYYLALKCGTFDGKF